jgi:hypothetical protein
MPTVIHFPVIRVYGYDNEIGELPIQFVVGQDLPDIFRASNLAYFLIGI